MKTLKHIIIPILAILVLITITACAASNTAKIPVKSMPPGATFDGLWYTDFGDMNLSSKGENIYGDFEHRTGGVIEGQVKGGVMRFKWKQLGDFNIGKREVEGHGYFVISNDGLSFTGQWGYADKYEGGGKWDGRKATEIY